MVLTNLVGRECKTQNDVHGTIVAITYSDGDEAPRVWIEEYYPDNGAVFSVWLNTIRVDVRIYKVYIQSVGDKKISIIKCIRDATGFGVKDCKDIVEAAAWTTPINKMFTKKEAEDLVRAIEENGGSAFIKKT